MEEDIENVEFIIRDLKADSYNKRLIGSLENLLTRYKQLEEKKERIIIEKAEALQEVRKYKAKVKDSIPKSKIKEKIEELEKEDLEIYDTDSEDVKIAKYEQRAMLNILKEILEEE